MARIIYTHTDEAPALASYSLLPIIETFAEAAGVEMQTRDISLAGRILAAFGDCLNESQRVDDALAELGRWATEPDANIIKLPNISASTPQLKAAIAELQSNGYGLPDYPDEPADDAEAAIRQRYDAVKGSAVNPVLRQGNSDRRAPRAVKQHARQYPHHMGEWRPDSPTHVATMSGGDFRSNEQSVTVAADDTWHIEHLDADGRLTTLRTVDVTAGEIADATFMSAAALRAFLDAEIDDAAQTGLLFSLHLKATMMKVSDPILFGHAVRAYFAAVFERHGDLLARVGADPQGGWGDVLDAVVTLPHAQRSAVTADIAAAVAERPPLAMVDSDRGITNLHVPSDVIVDASMPAMIRAGGRMWGPDGELHDVKAVIPDSSYAGVFQAVIDDCRANGAYDPTTMGSVPNVGLMAQRAEEYGSHDKTYEIARAGTVRVRGSNGEIHLSHDVAAGDVWRMCTVTDAAVSAWVDLAAQRARLTGAQVVFWLDPQRPHDTQLISKIRTRLNALADPDADDADAGTAGIEAAARTLGFEALVMAPAQACRHSLERIRRGVDTVSATGNVLRDYNTDLFPILELGTSAKMLSIVPLMAGGGLFETGAGGSAPKHVQQFAAENHLRWDSLGEFLALAVSLEHLARTGGSPAAQVLADALDAATASWLSENRAPQRRVGEPDTRASHFHLARHWAAEMAAQRADETLADAFAPLAAELAAAAAAIEAELLDCQGDPVDLGGYYAPDPQKAAAAMRPSMTLNRILADFRSSSSAVSTTA